MHLCLLTPHLNFLCANFGSKLACVWPGTKTVPSACPLVRPAGSRFLSCPLFTFLGVAGPC